MVTSPRGRITRGTTGTNRLRRVDRWIARHPALRRAEDPLVVDLGFGANAWTTLELRARLAEVRADAEVLGLEIDPERVARAREQSAAASVSGVSFSRGGFEVPTPGGRRPVVIRAMNVLRQYEEADVAEAWERMSSRLDEGGVLVEGTCDEIGRVVTWAAVTPGARPASLTVSLRLAGLERPSIAAERLPKALIHRNVPGERVHSFFEALDREWDRAVTQTPFGPVSRWTTALAALSERGWPLLGRSRWRLGEVTVPWESVAPR